MPVPWKERKLVAHGYMSRYQMAVLKYLIDHADDYGDTWHSLAQFNTQTVRHMRKRLFLMESDGPNGVEYCITAHGREMFDVFLNAPTPRHDGICPRCNERPRDSQGYCLSCARVVRRLWAYSNPDSARKETRKTCRHCNKRAKLIKGLCKQCDTAGRHKRNQEFADKCREHGAPICPLCNERPRHITARQVESYCRDCKAEYRQRHYQQRKKQRLNEKLKQSSNSG